MSLKAKTDLNKSEQNLSEEKDSNRMQFVSDAFTNASKALNNLIGSKQSGHSRSNSETFVDEKKKTKKQWFTKSKELDQPQKPSNSEPEPEKIESPPIEPVHTDILINCECLNHDGKEFLNNSYNLTVDFIYDCIYNTECDFNKKYQTENKFLNLKASDWDGNIRKLEYGIDLGPFGSAKSVEKQTLIKKIENQCIVMETETSTSGVPYADYFTVITKICITKLSAKKSKVLANVQINYKKKPNFVSKGFIEKNTFSNIKSCFDYIDRNLTSCQLSSNSQQEEVTQDLEHEPQLKEKEIVYEILENKVQKYDYNIKILNWNFKPTTICIFLLVLLFLTIAFNLRLYLRLNYAENVVFESLKSSRVGFDSCNNEISEECKNVIKLIEKDLNNWKSILSTTINQIKLIENSIKEFDKVISNVSKH